MEVSELLKDQVKVSAGGKLRTLQLTPTVSFSETPYTTSWLSSHTGASGNITNIRAMHITTDKVNFG